MSIQKLAGEASAHFERRKRDDGSEFYVRKDGSPEWIRDLVFAAHNAGDMLPDDHRHTMIVEALDRIAESGGEDDGFGADGIEAPIYTSELTAWLGSRADRAGYCDDAVSVGYCTDDASTTDRIGAGYIMEAREVHDAIVSFLRDADEDEDEDEDETHAEA